MNHRGKAVVTLFDTGEELLAYVVSATGRLREAALHRTHADMTFQFETDIALDVLVRSGVKVRRTGLKLMPRTHGRQYMARASYGPDGWIIHTITRSSSSRVRIPYGYAMFRRQTCCA